MFRRKMFPTERLIKLGIGLFPKADRVTVLATALPRAAVQ